MKRTMTLLVLLTALLMTAAATQAGLPAQEPNIWAPVGDLVGTTNHGTVTMTVLDPYGFEPKYTEDWQLNDKYSGSLLFGFFAANEGGTLFSIRSAGGTQLDGNTGGHLTFGATQPGKWGMNFDYRGFDHRYDTTSEMRTVSFAAGVHPPLLADIPAYSWNRAGLDLKYHASEAWHFSGGLQRMDRCGEKGSLLRGATGSAVPGLKTFDNQTDNIWLQANFSHQALAARVRFDLRNASGYRSIDAPHSYTDDQELVKLGLDLSYAVNPKTKVLAGGQYVKLTNTQMEMLGSTGYTPDSEATTTAGQLGVITKVARGTTLKISGQFKQQDTEGKSLLDDESVDHAMTRDRTATLFQAKVATTALKNARVQAYYKYDKSDLEEIVSQDALPGVATDFQATDQERTRNSAGLKLRYRFSKMACLKGGFGWNKSEITETTGGDDLLYKLGDRNLDRIKWQLALGLKPSADLRIDLGHQTIDQDYERVTEEVETTWKTQRGFLTVNWTAMPRLTVLASVSLGTDQYELIDGPENPGNYSPLMYDGTTLRYAPGVVFSATEKLTLEAIYEGVNFQDDGDVDDESLKLESDHMRLLLRAGYDVGEKARVTASYRRQEFDENRWDDYILDIYSLSVSGTF